MEYEISTKGKIILFLLCVILALSIIRSALSNQNNKQYQLEITELQKKIEYYQFYEQAYQSIINECIAQGVINDGDVFTLPTKTDNLN